MMDWGLVIAVFISALVIIGAWTVARLWIEFVRALRARRADYKRQKDKIGRMGE